MCTADLRRKNKKIVSAFMGGDRANSCLCPFFVAPVTKIFYYRIINNR